EHRFADNVAVHRINDAVAKIDNSLPVRAGGRLSDIELRIQRIELESVVVIRSGSGAGSHVAGTAQADLTRSIRLFALWATFRHSGCRGGNIPYQPVRDVHFRAFVLDRLRIMHQQNKTLSSHRNL